MRLRRFYIPGPLLLVALCVGCNRADPLEPVVQATFGTGPGSTPTAPSNANAVAASFSQINLSWQDNSSNEAGFELHRSTGGPSGTFALRASLGGNVISYSDVGLNASTQYCYMVRSFRTSGAKTSYSQFSSTACATTAAPARPPPPPPPPAAPSGVVATPEGSAMVWVWWTDNSTDETGFRLERSLDAGIDWTTAAMLEADSAYSYDVGRTSEQPVCYRVIAFNAGGDSPPSDTDCTTPPAGPTALTVAGPDSATGGVVLTWSDNSSVEDGYEVLSVDSDGGLVVLAELPASATSYVVSCDFDTYWVRAAKDRFAYAGYSDLSNDINPSFSPLCPDER